MNASRESTSARSSWHAAVRFLAAWWGLSLLPSVPAFLTGLAASPYAPLSVEVLVLVTLAAATAPTRWARAGRIAAGVGLGALLLYQAYDAIVYAAFRRSGILSEDLQYVVDLAYLAGDFVSWQTAPLVAAGLAAVGALAWAVPWALRQCARAGRHRACRRLLLAGHLVAWPLVLGVGPALEWGTENLTYQSTGEQVRFRTVMAKAFANAQASMRLRATLDTLRTAPVDSTYFAYDRLALERRPNVFLLMIESYGEVLDRHPDLRAPYRAMMRRLQDDLSAGGWHAASTVSDAPVRGGRSWLAIASALTGMRVENQLLYERFQSGTASAPHLVRFFDRQGYQTVTVQPYMLARPGLPLGNPYGFDVPLYRDDLPYDGPPYGWGVVDVPDQYSLGHAHAAHVAEATAPTFLFFETALSHALWNYGLPPVLDDWRAFDNATRRDDVRPVAHGSPTQPDALLPDSLTAPRIFDQPTPIRFLRHIAYEWEVLRRYLQRAVPPNSLVLVMGDHQPPLLDTDTFGVPVHALSRDASLVAPFARHGFAPGLLLSPESRRWAHEGLFSLTVRALAEPDAPPAPADTTARPPLRPDGVSPAILAR